MFALEPTDSNIYQRTMIFEQPFDTTFMTTFFLSLLIGQKQ